ncbi:hypothetical protein C8J56DRAFT_1165790 [Mycena floridula]|nr:hypothetical protein C8J56DRAFT_1165790 [Mycena floridula]
MASDEASLPFDQAPPAMANCFSDVLLSGIREIDTLLANCLTEIHQNFPAVPTITDIDAGMYSFLRQVQTRIRTHGLQMQYRISELKALVAHRQERARRSRPNPPSDPFPNWIGDAELQRLYDSQCSSIEFTVDRLRTRRDTALEFLHDLRRQHEPDTEKLSANLIYSLPAELLREIFGHCVAKETQSPTVRTHPTGLLPWERCYAAPWSLAQVNRRWRQIALGQTNLWSVIRFVRGYNDRRLDEQIKRSGRSFLDVTFQKVQPRSPALLRVLDASHRWKHLEYSLVLWRAEASQLPNLRSAFSTLPVLETFTCLCCPPPFVAPNLRTLSIPGSVSLNRWKPIVLPERAELVIKDISAAAITPLILFLINNSTVLRCKLSVTSRPAICFSPQILHLRSLSLHCIGIGSDCLTALLSYFALLPQLQELKIQGNDDHLPISKFVELFGRADVVLESLELSLLRLPQPDYLQLFAALPTIQTLSLKDVYCHGLVMALEEKTLLPRLKLLNIQALEGGTRFDREDMIQLTMAREGLTIQEEFITGSNS